MGDPFAFLSLWFDPFETGGRPSNASDKRPVPFSFHQPSYYLADLCRTSTCPIDELLDEKEWV